MLQSLDNWIEYILPSRSAQNYWNLNRQIRWEIAKILLEWFGAMVAEEIERVGRDENHRREVYGHY